MDFSFSDDQRALQELAEQIFTGSADVDRVKAVEASTDRFDRALWHELAAADLLGVVIPERAGGLGFGVVELCLVLEQQGRRVAPVPLLSTLVGAAALAQFGAGDPQDQWVARVLRGDVVLSDAFAERGANNVLRSSVRAERAAGGGWTLHGTKIAVPAAHVADGVLVPAMTADDALTVFLVSPASDGVKLEHNETTNREIHSTMHLDGVTSGDDGVVGDVGNGRAVVRWAVDRLQIGNCALALGACEEALAMTASYVSGREQFGRPLSTNQGVAIRAADAYIDVECQRVTLWQAAWRLDAGLTVADEIDVAKYWAAEGGQRVVHATQHLHGGMGADVDYPVHRTFLWVKQLENVFGGGTQHLARLGQRIAAGAIASPAGRRDDGGVAVGGSGPDAR
jgi:acyl-CoA dehydrogenase